MTNLLSEKDGVQFSEAGDGIGILSFTSKACAATKTVLTGIQKALKIAEQQQLKGIIIWQPNPKFFCVGADLPYVCQLAAANDTATMRIYLSYFQQTSLALRYSAVPVIAAITGYALGGGCELSMHCAKIVAEQNSRIGLVEAAIGLIPAGGGSKEMILRASKSTNYLATLKTYFLQIAQGVMSDNAKHAQALNYLRNTDVIVETHEAALETAKKQLQNLIYTVPESPTIPILSGIKDELMTTYENTVATPSHHDLWIAEHIANVFSGGGQQGPLTEQQLLDLELDAFITLVMHPLTQARIQHTLETGKHLHN